MIRLKCINTVEWQTVTPTMFPDGTSQIWKIVMPLKDEWVTVKWNFESESELIHLLQLSYLLENNGNRIHLNVPYFPYARQDKHVSNLSTFALYPIFSVLKSHFYAIHTYDVHNVEAFNEEWGIVNEKPIHIYKAIELANPDVIFYPDAGALTRYNRMFIDDKCALTMLPKAYGVKERDQLNGNIISYNIVNNQSLNGKNILIIDDLCDFGTTFIKAANELKKAGAHNIDLCVSHSVSYEGLKNVLENGIRHVYTTNSRCITVPNNTTVFEV